MWGGAHRLLDLSNVKGRTALGSYRKPTPGSHDFERYPNDPLPCQPFSSTSILRSPLHIPPFPGPIPDLIPTLFTLVYPLLPSPHTLGEFPNCLIIVFALRYYF